MSGNPQTEPEDPQPVLEHQRAEHERGVAADVDDTGVAPLVNNTGQDGDAPTG